MTGARGGVFCSCLQGLTGVFEDMANDEKKEMSEFYEIETIKELYELCGVIFDEYENAGEDPINIWADSDPKWKTCQNDLAKEEWRLYQELGLYKEIHEKPRRDIRKEIFAELKRWKRLQKNCARFQFQVYPDTPYLHENRFFHKGRDYQLPHWMGDNRVFCLERYSEETGTPYFYDKETGVVDYLDQPEFELLQNSHRPKEVFWLADLEELVQHFPVKKGVCPFSGEWDYWWREAMEEIYRRVVACETMLMNWNRIPEYQPIDKDGSLHGSVDV